MWRRGGVEMLVRELGKREGMRGNVPVLRIHAADHDADYDLVVAGFWDGNIVDGDFGAFGDDCFFHVGG